jgi:hypothetical protein
MLRVERGTKTKLIGILLRKDFKEIGVLLNGESASDLRISFGAGDCETLGVAGYAIGKYGTTWCFSCLLD